MNLLFMILSRHDSVSPPHWRKDSSQLANNRNNNNSDNRNHNNGFRCVGGVGAGSSPKAGTMGVMPGGSRLPGQSQEASLTAVPAPVGQSGQDAAQAVAGNSAAAERKSRPAFSKAEGRVPREEMGREQAQK